MIMSNVTYLPRHSLDVWRKVDAYLLAAGEPMARLGEMSPFYADRQRTALRIAELIIAGRHTPACAP